MQHSFLALVASLAILFTGTHVSFSQTNSDSASQKRAAAIVKIKKQVEKIGTGRTITVSRLDNRDLFGSVSVIEADGFQIIETDTKQILSFKYADLKNVRKGDGERNLITGKRKNPQRGWLYGLIILGALFTLLGIGLSDKDF